MSCHKQTLAANGINTLIPKTRANPFDTSTVRVKELKDTLLRAAQLELKAKTTFGQLKIKKAAFEAQKAEKECEKVAAENFIALLNKNTAISDYTRATGENTPSVPLPKERNK